MTIVDSWVSEQANWKFSLIQETESGFWQLSCQSKPVFTNAMGLAYVEMIRIFQNKHSRDNCVIINSGYNHEQKYEFAYSSGRPNKKDVFLKAVITVTTGLTKHMKVQLHSDIPELHILKELEDSILALDTYSETP